MVTKTSKVAACIAVAATAFLSSAATIWAQDTAAESPVIGTYGTWQLLCQAVKVADQPDDKLCFLSQDRKQAESGQRVIMINVFPAVEGKKVMRLMMPFGLELDAGVAIELDEENKVAGRFRTCVPGGCLVPFEFDAAAFENFYKYESAKVQALRVESDQSIVINFELTGLKEGVAALDAELAKVKEAKAE